MVDGIGGSSDEEEGGRPKSIINPSDAALLDDDEGDSKPTDRIAMSEDLKLLKLDGDDDGGAPFKVDPSLGADAEGGKNPFAQTGKKADKDSGQRAFDSVFSGADKKKDKPRGPERPATYTVQQGDTLFKISERFYGSSSHWRKIREANKATVPTDGRLNAGQVIILP